MITVFTPVYNREKTLKRLYDSLILQSSDDFEWLVVNDGSTDRSDEIIRSFIAEEKLNINYITKRNEGLNRTYNLGVKNAKGELFFRVDSDDCVYPDAIEQINKYSYLCDAENICGITFLTENLNSGKLLGLHPFSKIKESDYFEYRAFYGAIGDRAEVVKTSVLKEFPYPFFEGEKFCPEGLMWNRIAKKYHCYYIPKIIYRREYCEDSITKTVKSVLHKNWHGACSYYAEILNNSVFYGIKFIFNKRLFKYFIKAAISFYRYDKNLWGGVQLSLKSIFVGFLPGKVFKLYDRLKKRF